MWARLYSARLKKEGKSLHSVTDSYYCSTVHRLIHFPTRETAQLKWKQRMFTFIRHPIERAVSLFYYLAIAHWEPTYDSDLAYISIEMYARSKRIEHNWMVRFLTNELERDLTPRHLDLAKEVLRQKCIIGLVDEKNESWLRLMRLFGWEAHSDDGNECLDRHLNFVWSNKHNHPVIEEGTLAWELLYKQNELDMMLYEYAHLLFQEQSALFGEGGSLVT